MDLNSLEIKIKDYLSGDYEVEETKNIPSIEDVAFGKKAKKIKLCAFCIDLRKSSDLLLIHQKQTCGKIHKAFLTIVSQVVTEYGGEIRSYNGDGLLAFWPASFKSEIGFAVSAAMVSKYLLDIKFSPFFEQYSKIDFGIGIDWGDVYVLKAGMPRNSNNNDLVFIGSCVNFATAIANQAHGPKHIEISKSTYDNLDDKFKFSVRDKGQIVDVWVDGIVKWKGEDYKTKATSGYISLK